VQNWKSITSIAGKVLSKPWGLNSIAPMAAMDCQAVVQQGAAKAHFVPHCGHLACLPLLNARQKASDDRSEPKVPDAAILVNVRIQQEYTWASNKAG